MRSFRHGRPVLIQGYFDKQGLKEDDRLPCYLRLCDVVLSNHQGVDKPASWQASILECPVLPGPRPLQLRVHISDHVLSYYARDEHQHSLWCAALQKASIRVVSRFYRIGNVMQSDCPDALRVCEDLLTKEVFAVRVIPLRFGVYVGSRELDEFQRLSRPTHDIFIDIGTLNLVVEYVHNRDLLEAIHDQGTLSELHAEEGGENIIDAVRYNPVKHESIEFPGDYSSSSLRTKNRRSRCRKMPRTKTTVDRKDVTKSAIPVWHDTVLNDIASVISESSRPSSGALSLRNIKSIHEDQGYLSKIETICRKNLEMQFSIHGKNAVHTDIAWALGNLAKVCEDHEKLDEAAGLALKSYEMLISIHGTFQDIPSIEAAFCLLVRLYERLGKENELRRLTNRKCIELYHAIHVELGTQHANAVFLPVEELENLPLSKYLMYLQTCSFPFTDCVLTPDSCINRLARVLDQRICDVQLPTCSERLFVVTSRKTSDFLVLIDDFFLAYNEEDRIFEGRIQGSSSFKLNHSDMLVRDDFFDDLIGNFLSIQQVYFLARRLVQFTKASWEFDCLAQFEKQLPGAKILRCISVDILSEITIDLLPMNFNCLSACKVGFLRADDDSLYSEGIELFGQVIGFERAENHLGTPRIVNGVELEDCPEFTDLCGIAIGGSRHGETIQAITSSVPSSAVLGKSIQEINSTVKQRSIEMHSNTGSRLRIVAQIPKNLILLMHANFPVYNLAFIPKNAGFRHLATKRFSHKELDDLGKAFRSLGYGEQLSEALKKCVKDDIYWGRAKDVTTTIGEAQYLLFKRWEDLSHRNMVPFTMALKWHKRYLPKNKDLLVLNGDKLYVARSKRNVNFSISGGFKGFIFGTMTLMPRDLFGESPVSNILDAAERVSGIREHQFESFFLGGGKLPTRCGMEDLLGAISFTCLLLKEKAVPDGRFKNCVVTPGRLQPVIFNIPMPSGVVCSTFGRCCIRQPHWMLVDEAWDSTRDYEYPVVLGVGHNDSDLCTSMSFADWT